MRIIRRYLAREIVTGVGLVLMGFLGLTAFYDLIQELDDIGQGTYRFQHALFYVVMALPGHVYELMPVAALIGCIYALSQFASSSEFTAMRAAGMSRAQALRAIVGVGVLLAVLTGLAGEYVAPRAQQFARSMRADHLGETARGSFRSGFWIKDSLRDEAGKIQSLRFVNIGRLDARGTLEQLEIYEFDTDLKLQSITKAALGTFLKPAVDKSDRADEKGDRAEAGTKTRDASRSDSHAYGTGAAAEQSENGARPAQSEETAPGGAGVHSQWHLSSVERTSFYIVPGPMGHDAMSTRFERMPDLIWPSELTPGILAVLAVDPDSMSVLGLWRYSQHLQENNQNASRYELAMWRKIIYPVAIVVMLMLALPFGYIQARAGSVGLKLFIGIMLGVVFFFMNGLSTNLGLLNTWPPWIAVSIPSIVALIIALTLLARVGRSH